MALVVSIIIMLILAGVSIRAIVGEDGVLTKAREASIASKKASILEELNMELVSYSIESILESPEQAITILEKLINKGLVNAVLSSSGKYVADAKEAMGIPQVDDDNKYTGYIDFIVKKEDYPIIISIDDSGIYKAEYVNTSSGGTVKSGTTIVTEEAFTNNEGAPAEEQGKFVIVGDEGGDDPKLMFVDKIDGELSIQVKSGTHATIYSYRDMTLTNSGIKRSAIDIEPGGTLDLHVAYGTTLIVNSGLGEDANVNVAGKGGYAGIHVPWIDTDNDNIRDEGEYATLNLYGEGTVKAIAGDAGSGANAYGSGSVTAGGGGAGAGIGGNGGNGSNGKDGEEGDYKITENGGAGESCGNVNIYNSLKIYAYGGAGGAGGTGGGYQHKGAGGGGGYPGAGIGGGGAGGAGSTCCAGAGGYTGGSGSGNKHVANNGLSGYGYGRYHSNGDVPTVGRFAGGGYYACGDYSSANPGKNYTITSFLGGVAPSYYWGKGHEPGFGGTAGQGGIIKVANSTNVYSFNGNLYTDGTDYNNGGNQSVFYAQAGISVAKYDYNNVETNGGVFNTTLISELKSVTQSGYNNTIYESDINYKNNKNVNINTLLGITGNPLSEVDMSKQGVGSGAGYIEVSNGTYTVDQSMN